MTDEVATTAVPTEPLKEHLVALAREVGEYHDHVSPPERGVEADVEWDWDDIDWDVGSYPDTGEIELHGFTEGSYGVQTARARYNPPGKAHPAEYEHRTMPIGVTIHVNLDDGHALDFGAFTIEVGVA